MPVKSRPFRPGEVIIALRPEMLLHPLAFGYPAPALQLLAMLRNNFGAVVKTLWPVGVDVLAPSPAPLPPGLPAYVSELAAAGPAMFVKEKLDGLEWLNHGILTRSRLRLHARVADPGRVEAALSQIRESPAVLYAEAVPLIVAPKFEATNFIGGIGGSGGRPMGMATFGGVQTSEEDRFSWHRKAMGRPKGWDQIVINSIAVLDSGFDGGHRALPYAAVNYGTTESQKDNYGHGTFICGTLVGRADVARSDEEPALPPGIFPSSRVWTMKVIVRKDGTDELDAGRYSLALNVIAEANTAGMWLESKVTRPPLGIQVVSLSIWSGEETWLTEKDDIAKLEAKNILVVASAGNGLLAEGTRSKVRHPAALPWCISVGAHGPKWKRWKNTNLSTPDTGRDPSVDIYAPGERIIAALPENKNFLGQSFGGVLTGTSMATPFVAACAAVLRAKDPLITRQSVINRLKGSAQFDADLDLQWWPLYWESDEQE